MPNDYFDVVRETAVGMVEEVKLLDKYENTEKFGVGNISYAFRITYRSLDKTLLRRSGYTPQKIEDLTTKTFGGTFAKFNKLNLNKFVTNSAIA